MLLHVQDYEHLISKRKQLTMKPMIVDADKLEENIKHPFSKVSDEERMKSDIAEMILSSLVPYEEKKEIPSILYGNGCGGTKDHRCMKCNGEGKLMNQWDKATCVYCNGTGKEPQRNICKKHGYMHFGACTPEAKVMPGYECKEPIGGAGGGSDCPQDICESNMKVHVGGNMLVHQRTYCKHCREINPNKNHNCSGKEKEPMKETHSFGWSDSGIRECTKCSLSAEDFANSESSEICRVKEPRKEQDTRTHAWETKTYTQDTVRKMLEGLKAQIITGFLEDDNSRDIKNKTKGYNICAEIQNAKIDKKIAELYSQHNTSTMADLQKMRFLDVFEEDKSETLTLRVKLRVKGEDFNVGDSFTKGEKIGSVDFHILRYFDLAMKHLEGDIYEVTGFFPQK